MGLIRPNPLLFGQLISDRLWPYEYRLRTRAATKHVLRLGCTARGRCCLKRAVSTRRHGLCIIIQQHQCNRRQAYLRRMPLRTIWSWRHPSNLGFQRLLTTTARGLLRLIRCMYEAFITDILSQAVIAAVQTVAKDPDSRLFVIAVSQLPGPKSLLAPRDNSSTPPVQLAVFSTTSYEELESPTQPLLLNSE